MKTTKDFLQYDELLSIIGNLHDEINIWDHDYKLLYISDACERHYGLKKEEMIGKKYDEFMKEGYWYPGLLPRVYKEKIPLMITQRTYIGETIVSIAKPIFDEAGEIKYIVSSVREDMEDIPYLTVNEMERKKFEEKYTPSSTILYKSPKMEEVMSLTYKLANVEVPVVILGESGVGKTLLAKEMHKSSNRSEAPFINVNCGAIPKDLIEAELFGYEEGSFTGAKKHGRKGLFEAAHGGTLLLDDISELPYMLQSKLLQVVQEKEFLPVGGQQTKKVDVKIIAATNKDLKRLVEAGDFREDLYYRLSVFEITIPPLRDRGEDIEILSQYFLSRCNETYKKKHQLSKEAISIIKQHSWQGNVRELSHLIERLVVTASEYIIMPRHLPKNLFYINQSLPIKTQGGLDEIVEDYKKNIVLETYDKFKSSRKVASELKISQSKASRLIRQYTGKDIKSEE